MAGWGGTFPGPGTQALIQEPPQTRSAADSSPQAWFPPSLVNIKVTCSLWGRCAFETDELKDSRQLGKASAPCPAEGPSSSSWNQGTEIAHRYTRVHIPPFPGSHPHQAALSSRQISHVFQEDLCRNRGGNLYLTLGSPGAALFSSAFSVLHEFLL